MSMKKADRPLLDQTGAVLDYDGVHEAMAYLGYTPGPQTDSTAAALAGRATVSVVLGSLIAEEYARQAPK